MSDIHAGDVVECVSDDWLKPSADAPKSGDVLRVLAVNVAPGSQTGAVGTFLKFTDRRHYWIAWRFRKIEAPKSELSERIRKCRPIPAREDA